VTTPAATTGPDAARATWRAWAADIRDHRGPHAHVGEDAALLAGSLAGSTWGREGASPRPTSPRACASPPPCSWSS
jgi:hypothetical protein